MARHGIARLFEMTSDLLATISLDGRFTLLNPAWEQLLGWTREELQAQPIAGVHAPRRRRADARADARRQRATAPSSRTSPTATATATARGAGCCGARAATATPGTRPPRTSPTALWLERQALHDPLTQLPNRLLLMDRARQALARLHRSDGVVAMLFIDLDKFKAVNDNLGHDVGDRAAGRRLRAPRRADARQRHRRAPRRRRVRDPRRGHRERRRGARARPSACSTRSSEPFPLGNGRSGDARERRRVGRARPRHRPRGDAARGRRGDVPGQGRGRTAPGAVRREPAPRAEHATSRSRAACATRCRGSELLLAYQPILPLAGGAGGRLRGARALAPAGRRPDRLATSCCPSTFLPPAEESELIVQIGNWVLHTACAQAEAWRRSGIAIPISVNVSARELTELDLAERVREELAYCRLPGRALCLEVSEEAVQRDPERARAALQGRQAPRRVDRARQLRLRAVLARAAEQPAARHRQARPRPDRQLRPRQGAPRDVRGDDRARQGGRADRGGGRHRDQPPAGARARARLLGRPGLPAARPGRAAERLRLRERGRVGNVRAMASPACDWAAATRR